MKVFITLLSLSGSLDRVAKFPDCNKYIHLKTINHA